MKNIFTAQFLFQINPIMLGKADKLFLAAALVLLALAAVFKLSAIYAPTPVDSRFRQKFFNLFLFLGLGELVWYGCRYEDIRFFGTHFTALLILLIGMLWFIGLAVQIVRHYSGELQDFQKQQLKLKYLQK